MKFTPNIWYIIKQKLNNRNFLYEFYFKNKKVLDVGCGDGEFLTLNKDQIFGVDINQNVINNLKNHKYQVYNCDVSSLPFADNEFDAAHSRNVIEHLNIDKAYSMIKEVSRVIKSGSLFVIGSEVVSKKFWNTFGHTKPYPPQAIIKLLRKDSREGFDGITDFEVVGLFYLGDYYKNKLVYFISFVFGFFTSFFRREYFLILRKK